MNVADELERLLKDAAKETGRDLKANLAEVTLYAAERTAYLSTLVGQPGFEEAVRAERDNVTLKSGIASVKAADAADARVVGIIQGVLFLGARALATA